MPLLAARPRAHQQPRVVVAHGRRADHDRVAGCAHGVDAVEVGVVGQLEAPRRRAAEVAVDRHAAAQEGVRAVSRQCARGTHETTRHGSAGKAGDEHQDAVDDGGGDPSSAPSPAAPNAQAAAPSRGPQPPALGSTMASITSSASGSICDIGAVTPAVRAAIRKVAAWPQTTSADASAMPPRPGEQRHEVGEQPRAGRAPRPPRTTPADERRRPAHDATSGIDERTGDGSARSTGHGQDRLHDLAGESLPRDGP